MTTAAKMTVRLAGAMVSLAVILLVSRETGSFAAAGSVYGVYAACLAVGNPVQGRLCDRFGTRRILRVTGALNAAGILGLVAACSAGAPVWLLVAVGAAAGSMEPPVDPVMRAVWERVHHADRVALEAGHRWETLTIAVTFLIAPLLVAVCVALASAAVALVAAAAMVACGSVVFTASSMTQHPRHADGGAGVRGSSLHARPPVSALIVIVCYTTYITSWWMMSVAIPGVMTETGRRPLSGVLIAMVSVGTLARGLWSAARVRALTDREVSWQFALSMLVLGVAISACAAADPGVLGRDGSTAVLAVCLLVAGGAVADAITLGHRWVGALTPKRSLTTMYALIGTGVGAGTAVGTAAGGALVDVAGGTVALLMAGVPALCGAAASALLRALHRRSARRIAETL